MRPSFLHVIFWALEALIWHPSSAFQANWTSPTDGDVFGPGEYILGQWLSDEAASNISFRLCNAEAGPSMDNMDCGQAIQPAVVDNDDGSHQVTLAAPSVADPSHFYLQMFEDPGDPITSPTFTISPSNTSAGSISTTSTSDDASLSANAHSLPVIAQSRSPAATAAYAVPLSLAGAIVLIASIVGIYQRRKLLAERAADEKETTDFKEHFMHKRLRGFTFWHSRPQTDRAPPTPQEKPDDAYTRMFVPQMHRTRTRGPRQATREPYPTRITGKSVPAGLFKATLSPRIPYTSNESPAAHRFCSPPPSRDRSRAAEINAAVHESVVSHYLQPSPVPSPSPSPMKQAHIRKHSTPDCGGAVFVDMDKLYEEVARRIQ